MMEISGELLLSIPQADRPDKGENPGVSTIGTPQAINNWPHLYIFFKFLGHYLRVALFRVKNSENLLLH